MASDQAERSVRRHRALADPSRARILSEIAGDVALDARQLADRMGLHVNTVRAHLGALEEAGLVRSATVPPSGRGRPRLVYRSSDEAVDDVRRYRLLAEILTALVARSETGPAPLEEIGELWGHHLVESPPPFDRVDPDAAIARLVLLLDESGFAPALERAGDETRILMRPCPFLELARRHPDVVCPIHLGLMRGALAELGGNVTAARLQPFVEPNLCVAQLRAPGAAGRRAARRKRPDHPRRETT